MISTCVWVIFHIMFVVMFVLCGIVIGLTMAIFSNDKVFAKYVKVTQEKKAQLEKEIERLRGNKN